MPSEYLNSEGYLDLGKAYGPYPHQFKLHTSTCTNLAAIGGNGSGKSQFLLWEAVLNYTLRFPGCDCLLLRRSFKELDKGLISDLLNSVPNPDKQLFTYNDTKHVATFYNGSRILFGHCETNSEKDLYQYLSSSFCFIGVDEAGQFRYEAWEFLKSRNRPNPGCKADADGQMPICKIALATNPMGIGWGWVKKLFREKEPVEKQAGCRKDENGRYWIHERDQWRCIYDPADYIYTFSTIMDNPGLMARDPNYVDRLQKLPPALRQRALYGDMDSLAGQYYTNFDDSYHVANINHPSRPGYDPEKIVWQDFQPSWCSWDFGMGHYSAIIFFRRALLRRLDGEYKQGTVIYREIVQREKSSRDLVTLIHASLKKNEQGAPIERIQHLFFSHEKFNRSGTDTSHRPADDVTIELRRYGLPPVSRASNDRVAGAVQLYNLLEYGDVVILDDCVDCISAIKGVTRDESNLEDVVKTDTKEDDVFDAIKYGLLSMLMPRAKPREALMRERAAEIQDPYARHFFVVKNQESMKDRNEVVRPKNTAAWRTRYGR